ncbi:MAG: DUF58 domain-containing protein [Clostridia bacterium]|nr:DUF58 domain-containing protein [Clostridia bacterium]NCC43962.1 DUF58 domain-containing protein [Clostridia bacterium]
MWKRRIVYIVLFLAVGGMYVAADKRQILVLLILLAVLPVISAILLFIGAGKVHIDCELQEACIIHQRIGMKIKVCCSSRMILGRSRLKAEYENLLFSTTKKQTIYLERAEKKEAYYELPYESQNCGKIKFKFSDVVCCDAMGLFSKKCHCVSEHEFTVFPQISELQISMKHLPESSSSGSQYDQNKKGQDVTEVFGMREYREGDSQRSIHWKLSSKLDKIIVREFSYPSNYYTLVLYDTSFDKKNSDYAQIVNGVLGMTASVSRGLLNMSHIHHVGTMCKSIFADMVVEDNDSSQQSLTNMMSTSVSTMEEAPVDEFIKQGLYEKFTKIVLVTGVFDENRMRNLANYVDLTVLLIVKGQIDYVDKGPNYDVITLDVDVLATKIQMLDI